MPDRGPAPALVAFGRSLGCNWRSHLSGTWCATAVRAKLPLFHHRFHADGAPPLPIAPAGGSHTAQPCVRPLRARLVGAGAGSLTASSRASCSNFSIAADFAHAAAPPLTRPPRSSPTSHHASSPNRDLPATQLSQSSSWPSATASATVSSQRHGFVVPLTRHPPQMAGFMISLWESVPLPARSFVPRRRPFLLTSYSPPIYPRRIQDSTTAQALREACPPRVRCPCANCTAVIPSSESPALAR